MSHCLADPLQERIAEIDSGLPEARGFALAGAGGLLVQSLIERQTRDLDYFTVPGEEEALSALRDALERALDRAGLDHVRQRDLSAFVRIEMSDGDDRCEINLAIDYRALPAEPSDYGPTLAVRELAANKVLATTGFLEALSSLRRFTAADFGITEAEYERLRATVASWQNVLSREQGREPPDRGLGLDR